MTSTLTFSNITQQQLDAVKVRLLQEDGATITQDPTDRAKFTIKSLQHLNAEAIYNAAQHVLTLTIDHPLWMPVALIRRGIADALEQAK